MDTSVFHRFNDIETKEIAPGFFSKLIHTETNTINFIEVKAGCSVIRHRHMHQQCAFVIEGRFELIVDDIPQVLEPGVFAQIPPDTWHGGTALTDCKLIDVFSPSRDDYKLL